MIHSFRSYDVMPFLARWSLALGYLSAVVDRFGVWGAPIQARVAWGAWDLVAAYTAELTPDATPSVPRFLASAIVFAEVFLALVLLLGWRLRATSLASAALFATFALTMTVTLGVEAPLDYSVFAFVAASLLLASHPAAAVQGPPCGDPYEQPRATLVQLHIPVLDASLPRWRCLAPVGAFALAALVALALSTST